MHRISKQSAQNAQEHATIALRHGFSIELHGKFLPWRDEPTLQEYGHFIEDYDQMVQLYAEESLRYSESLHKQDYSTKLYGLAVEAHVGAIRMYSSAIREKLLARKKRSL